MTEILFSIPISEKKNYVVKSIDMAISSLEEFCYFYAKNIVLLDDSIMQEDFEDWIATELQFPVLSRNLRQVREQKQGCVSYFSHLLNELHIFSEAEKIEIIDAAKVFVNRNENQRRKLLGDQLFVREKYQSAIREYYGLTTEESFIAEENGFIGSVWHNLGCCYGMCFMFDEALECLKTAYSYNFSPKTQEAVTFLVKLKESEHYKTEPVEDNFFNYLDYTGQSGRDNRYEQIAERLTEYRRGIEE